MVQRPAVSTELFRFLAFEWIVLGCGPAESGNFQGIFDFFGLVAELFVLRLLEVWF